MPGPPKLCAPVPGSWAPPPPDPVFVAPLVPTPVGPAGELDPGPPPPGPPVPPVALCPHPPPPPARVTGDPDI